MIRIQFPTGVETLDLASFEERVRCGEIPPDTPINFALVTGEAFIPARQLEIFRGLYRPNQIYFTRYFNLAAFPWITASLVLANLGVFVLGLYRYGSRLEGAQLTASLVHLGAKAGPLIVDLGESYRLLSANFVHRDWLHLIFNLFVFFNVGGALENAYRRVDYLLIVLFSAIGTTVLSFLGSSAISAGSSGIVFGCFGGVVIFGLKYRKIIPPQYRRFFGGSVLPYVLVFLWVGWMSHGIDNWGHLGGLTGGTLTTLLLKPRLLEAATLRSKQRPRRLALLLLVVGGVIAIGPATRGLWPVLVSEQDEEFGLVMTRPMGWRRAVTSFGQLGFSNSLPEATYVQAVAELRPGRPSLRTLADDWFTLQLVSKEHGGFVRGVRREPARALKIAGVQGIELRAAFETTLEVGPPTTYLMRLYVFARGDIACTVVLLSPQERYAGYAPVFDRMVEELRFVAPAFLKEAARAVEAQPTLSDPRLQLAEAWSRLGRTDLAAKAYEETLALDPTSLRVVGPGIARLAQGAPRLQPRASALLDRLLEETEDHEERLQLLLLAVRGSERSGARAETERYLLRAEALAPADAAVKEARARFAVMP